MISDFRYALSELRENATDRHWLRGRSRHYFLGGFHKNIWPRYGGSLRVMEADWDNLVVLDACRRELFESVVGSERFDEYRTVRSLGSNTGEWTNRNFNDESERTEFGDTVYVNANVSVSRRVTEPTFHRLYDVCRTDFDDELGTVPPEPVVVKAREARMDYPRKRLVVHVLQPHAPFMTTETDGYTTDPEDVFGPGTELTEKNVWLDLAAGNVTTEAVKRAYRKTLEIAWQAVEGLVEDLPGRTVVTTDHGNMWGEPGFPIPIPVYEHPAGLRCPELVDVPWGVVEADGERPAIVDDGVQEAEAMGDEQRRRQLQALGYLD